MPLSFGSDKSIFWREGEMVNLFEVTNLKIKYSEGIYLKILPLFWVLKLYFYAFVFI